MQEKDLARERTLADIIVERDGMVLELNASSKEKEKEAVSKIYYAKQ